MAEIELKLKLAKCRMEILELEEAEDDEKSEVAVSRDAKKSEVAISCDAKKSEGVAVSRDDKSRDEKSDEVADCRDMNCHDKLTRLKIMCRTNISMLVAPLFENQVSCVVNCHCS